MIGWSLESIRKYSPKRLVIPTAMTITEAFQQTAAGAHFIKMVCSDLDQVRLFRSAPVFDFCPIFLTGGMTLARIPQGVEAGAVLVGAGFDLILKGRPGNVSRKTVTHALSQYIEAARAAREKAWPRLARAIGGKRELWLQALPHHHPF